MCTVSVIALPGWSSGGFRLACNRDELLSRPIALPPEIHRFRGRRAVIPIDPTSHGTWIAVNDAGVEFALLNLNRRGEQKFAERCSRGRIILSLLHCDTADDALDAARQIDQRRYPPFRLVIIDGQRWGEILSDGRQLDVQAHPFDAKPLVFTSSSLGDDLVEQPRRELFSRIVGAPTPDRQDAFHLHAWPDRPHLSVNMSRADARTVSRTVVEVTDGAATMRYFADGFAHVLRLENSRIQLT
jgi:hypothetical protein